MNSAWSLLTIEGVRQYGGNSGYVDDPKTVYRYDSDVANHRRVKVGDIAFVRSRTAIIGLAEIEEIRKGSGPKDRLRCPECNVTNIKRRATKTPPWGCKNGHLFEFPINEPVTVRTFEAVYGSTFRPAPSGMNIFHLNTAVLRPSDQMSIKEIDLAQIEPFLIGDPELAPMVRSFAADLQVPEYEQVQADEEIESLIERRRRVLREISLRRGQRQFREKLIRRYGMRCQISGYDFPAAIEACHIRPYAFYEENSVGNGLLLRSDLHTLFDLGLIGINPDTLKLKFNPACLGHDYARFDGQMLFINRTSGPDIDALREHWKCFQNNSGKAAF